MGQPLVVKTPQDLLGFRQSLARDREPDLGTSRTAGATGRLHWFGFQTTFEAERLQLPDLVEATLEERDWSGVRHLGYCFGLSGINRVLPLSNGTSLASSHWSLMNWSRL